MYDFLASKNGYPYTALHFANEPKIPLKERGKAFRYTIAAPSSDSRRMVASNLEFRSEQMTISSMAPIDFAPETYVVIGADLYRIVSSTKRTVNDAQGAMVRRPIIETTMILDKCNNPVGVTRL